MKVVRLYRFNDLRVEEEPIPDISDEEILVKVHACGICTGETMPWYIERKAPLVIGHEPAGVVEKVGAKVRDFQVGDRVFVHHHGPCMKCKYCLRGDHVQCTQWKDKGIYPGGLSEYIKVTRNSLGDTLKLPEGVSFEEATLIEPVACVVKSLKRSMIKEGDTMLVIGLGVMGILHIILARCYGVSKIAGADKIRYRLEAAKRAGADIVVDVTSEDLKEAMLSFTDGKGPEIVIVGPGYVEVIQQAIDIVSAGGTVLIFTPVNPGSRLQLDINQIYFKDISLVPSYSCGPEDTKQALEHIYNGHIDSSLVITHTFPVDKAPEAYRLVSQADASLKVIVTF